MIEAVGNYTGKKFGATFLRGTKPIDGVWVTSIIATVASLCTSGRSSDLPDVRSDYDYIRSYPDAINWFCSSKKRSTNFLSCVITDCLYHLKILQHSESFSNALAVDVLVHIHADYEPVTLFSPLP